MKRTRFNPRLISQRVAENELFVTSLITKGIRFHPHGITPVKPNLAPLEALKGRFVARRNWKASPLLSPCWGLSSWIHVQYLVNSAEEHRPTHDPLRLDLQVRQEASFFISSFINLINFCHIVPLPCFMWTDDKRAAFISVIYWND